MAWLAPAVRCAMDPGGCRTSCSDGRAHHTVWRLSKWNRRLTACDQLQVVTSDAWQAHVGGPLPALSCSSTNDQGSAEGPLLLASDPRLSMCVERCADMCKSYNDANECCKPVPALGKGHRSARKL